MKKIQSFTTLLFLVVGITAIAQNYHAIQGSYYAGGLGVYNNPASIANMPFKWDVTIVGAQLKSSNNFIRIVNYSLLSNPAKSQYFFSEGNYARKARLNGNVNLLNTAIALNRKTAIGFGANLKTYSLIKTKAYNYIDTLKKVGDFFKLNNPTDPLEGDMLSSTWLEIYGTYAKTMLDNATSRLNAGFSLKAAYSLAGGLIQLDNGNFQRLPSNTQPSFIVTDIKGKYAYSSNLDRWNKEASISENINTVIGASQSGASFDIGVEYLIKTQEVTNVYDDDSYNDYEWKIELSFLDLGFQRYTYGLESRAVNGVLAGLTTDRTLDKKLNNVKGSIKNINDSIASMFNFENIGTRQFYVANPMRAVLNIDRYLTGNFFINADLSVNLGSLLPKKYYYTKELNLLTITPHWETRLLGAYLPISYNTRGQFWIGGAIKAGPLLLGVHNWANIFSTKKVHNGGAYIALSIHPFANISDKRDPRLNCPKTNLASN